MLTQTGNGNYLGGEADVICILQLPGGTFHVAFFEEHPLPGPIKPIKDLDLIRLKSKMHRTEGATTLEDAQKHLDDMRTKIKVPDNNVIRDQAIEVDDPVNMVVLPNWIKKGVHITKVL